MRKNTGIAWKKFQVRHPDFVEFSHHIRMPQNSNAFKCSKHPRESNSPLVRHVNVKSFFGIKCKAVVRKQHIVTVTGDHFFGKMMFITHHGIQMHAVFEQPPGHVVAVFWINYIVARGNSLAEIREQLAIETRIRFHDSEFHFGTRPQELADNGHATRCMSQPPIQWSYKDFHFSASNQASAQSPWSQSLLSPINTRKLMERAPLIFNLKRSLSVV